MSAATGSKRLRFRIGFIARYIDVTLIVVPGWNLVTPPQLARDTPVLNIIEPLVVGRGPVFRDKLDFTGRYFFKRDFSNRLPRKMRAFGRRFAHRYKPLVCEHRFDHHTGTVTAWHHQFVRLNQFK